MEELGTIVVQENLNKAFVLKEESETSSQTEFIQVVGAVANILRSDQPLQELFLFVKVNLSVQFSKDLTSDSSSSFVNNLIVAGEL